MIIVYTFQVDLVSGRRVSGLVTKGEEDRQVTTFLLYRGLRLSNLTPYTDTNGVKVCELEKEGHKK